MTKTEHYPLKKLKEYHYTCSKVYNEATNIWSLPSLVYESWKFSPKEKALVLYWNGHNAQIQIVLPAKRRREKMKESWADGQIDSPWQTSPSMGDLGSKINNQRPDTTTTKGALMAPAACECCWITESTTSVKSGAELWENSEDQIVHPSKHCELTVALEFLNIADERRSY